MPMVFDVGLSFGRVVSKLGISENAVAWHCANCDLQKIMTFGACSQVITSFLWQNSALLRLIFKKTKFLERFFAETTVSFGGVKLVYLQNNWSTPGLAHFGRACK